MPHFFPPIKAGGRKSSAGEHGCARKPVAASGAMILARLSVCILLASLLSACVGSEKPLLPEAQAIADPSLAGVWSYKDGDKPVRVDVTSRDRTTFTITDPQAPGKNPITASLHSFEGNRFILQMRSDPRPVMYGLVMRDAGKPGRVWRMRLDICNSEIAQSAGVQPIKADRFTCILADRAQLNVLLRRAAADVANEGKYLDLQQERGR
jgi:hypothetical protein